MSNTKFTPGPWYMEGQYVMANIDGDEDQAEWLAKVERFADQYKEEEEANKALIAAAPELHDELQKSVEQMLIGLTAVQKLVEKSGTAKVLSKIEKEMMAQIRNANAALAKARGEKTDEQ